MRLIKIGLGNANPTVGAFTANVDQCIELARAMASEDVTVALFPEQVIGGYTPEDLVQWQGFVDGQWAELKRFAEATAELPMVCVIGAALGMQGLRYNCAAVVAGGAILGVVPKE
jgi:NAD+ synthase (glutamine-hydrolysing)